jgi:GntR family transcriptional regulator/MocR family aminotransferase
VDLHVSLEGRSDLCGQVYRQIRAAIADGLLRPGETLPSTRELARRLSVARNTVAVAYDRLAAEGFVRSRTGAGTYVSPQVGTQRQPSGVDSPLRARPVWDRITAAPDMSTVDAIFDFRVGIPDATRFPFAPWRTLIAGQLRPSAVGTGAHIGSAGHPGLRAAIARHIGVSRAVRATADDVLVTNGSQQAVDLLARVLLEPGDVVAVEDPGYPPPHRAFRSVGSRVVGVPVDTEGLVVDALPDTARLVYVTPSHQFPLGPAMSLPRRLALLDWADRVDAAIVEDDYDSEFRYGGRPLEPLHALDHTGRVLYVGSFSKILLPTLRLGFLVAPAPLHRALRKAKSVADWHTEVPAQAAAARFIDDGHLARHVRRMRGIYAQRHYQVATALATELADHLRPIRSPAGLHIAATLRRHRDDAAVVAAAAADGIALQPLSAYAVSAAPPPGLLFGYGAIQTDRIAEGLRRLRRCLERL